MCGFSPMITPPRAHNQCSAEYFADNSMDQCVRVCVCVMASNWKRVHELRLVALTSLYSVGRMRWSMGGRFNPGTPTVKLNSGPSVPIGGTPLVVALRRAMANNCINARGKWYKWETQSCPRYDTYAGPSNHVTLVGPRPDGGVVATASTISGSAARYSGGNVERASAVPCSPNTCPG